MPASSMNSSSNWSTHLLLYPYSASFLLAWMNCVCIYLNYPFHLCPRSHTSAPLKDLAHSHVFIDHLYDDFSQIYIYNPGLFPEVKTYITNLVCLSLLSKCQFLPFAQAQKLNNHPWLVSFSHILFSNCQQNLPSLLSKYIERLTSSRYLHHYLSHLDHCSSLLTHLPTSTLPMLITAATVPFKSDHPLLRTL